jgi:DNA repair exonuclease SbcCD ATPase subunit
MHVIQRAGRYTVITAAAIILAACAGQKQPAQKLIGDIEATVTAASAEAAKYVPDQLADVQSKLGALKASYDKQDYAAVVTGGPAVLTAAQSLATAAAAKKDEMLKALNDEWTGLSGSVSGAITAIQSRMDLLSKKSSKKMAAGIDLAAAKSGLSDATSLWSKAQAAFASGNLDEAVSTAKDVKAKIEALAASLKLDLSAPAAEAR